jgi:hypothetical protein
MYRVPDAEPCIFTCDDGKVSNTWSRTFISQSAACCYLGSANPIVQDGTTPLTQETRLYPRDSISPVSLDSYAWKGDYAWGSSHAGVIVAAMGDGSVLSLNKNMNANAFYNLAASNILPEPTDEEKRLAEEEYLAILARETTEGELE